MRGPSSPGFAAAAPGGYDLRVNFFRAVALFAACSVANAQALDPAAIDRIISTALKASGAPGVSVSVVQDGKLAYAKAFGEADVAAGRAADAHTRYAIGSISKEFTAAAILMLAEQDKLSLDDKVAKYFPALTRASEVSIRQLLSHTAGYEDYAPQDYIIPEWTQPTTPQAILDRWAKKPLNFDPGTRWQYSNTNFVLAGEIFEKASGQKLLDFLREKIFMPLGMTTASDCDEKSPLDAAAYTRYALGPPRPVQREASGWYFAAGELCMVPSDLSRWDIALLQKKLLSAHSYEEFTREVKLADGKPTHYALGLQVGESDGVRMIYHGGEVSGFLALNEIFPDQNASVTVLSNEDGLNLIGPLAHSIAAAVMHAAAVSPAHNQIRSILEGLQKGRIDRSMFTSDANSYFSEVALADYRSSLESLGKLKAVTLGNESLRGGMTHRSYKAEFESRTVNLNVYVLPNGKVEQFLVEQQL